MKKSCGDQFVRSRLGYSVLWHHCHLIAENFLYKKYELYLSL